MAANALAMNYTDLVRHIGREINASRDSADWSSATTQDIADIVANGLRQVYWPPVLPGEQTPHEWSFLQPQLGELTIYPAYETGSVAIASGVVTLTGGTWPSWAAQGDLWVSGERYPVNTRDSNTQVTLNDLTVTVTAGATFSLLLTYYALPDDFGGLVRDQGFVLRRDTQRYDAYPQPRMVSEAMIARYDTWPHRTGTPTMATLLPRTTTTEDTRWYARFWPVPYEELNYDYRYQVVPPLMNGTTVTHHYGGPQLSNLVVLSCLDKAMRFLYSSDEYYARFMTELAACVRRDRAANGRETYGYGVFSDGITHGIYDYDDLRRLRRATTTLGNIDL